MLEEARVRSSDRTSGPGASRDPMTIEIQGVPATSALRARITTRLTEVLRPLTAKPVAAKVSFFDEDGPRRGPGIRCALTVRLPRCPAMRAEHVADTARRAFDGSFASLERQLARYRERWRERRRRARKYPAQRLPPEAPPPDTEG